MNKDDDNIPKYEDTTSVHNSKDDVPLYEDTIPHSQEDDGIFSQDLKDIKADAADAYDLAKGVGQGVTLGFGDELLGGAQALGKKAGEMTGLSDKSGKSLAELYRQYQKSNEADWDQAKERSPYLTTAGEIAGGAMLAGPLGLLGKGAAAVGEGAALAKKASLAELAGKGALTGMVAGAGGSKGTIEDNPEKIALDSAFGGVIGGSIPYLGAGLGKVGTKLGKKIEDSPIARQHLRAFMEGLKGKSFTGDENTLRVSDLADEHAADLSNKIKAGKDYISGKYGDTLKANISLSPEESSAFDTAKNILETAKTRTGAIDENMMARLNKLKSGEINAQDLKELQKYFRENAFKINQGETSDQFIEASRKANDLLKQKVPGYNKVNDQFRQFEEPIEEFITDVPSEHLSVRSQPKDATLDTNLFKNARGAIEKSSLPFQEGKKQLSQLSRLKNGLEDAGKADPELMKAMGIDDLGAYFNKIKTASDEQSVGKIIGGVGGLNKSAEILGTGLKGTYGASNLAGRAVGALKLPELSKGLYTASDETLREVANKLNGNGMGHIGNALSQALDNKSQAAKNAILFTIMQNPEARKAVTDDQM